MEIQEKTNYPKDRIQRNALLYEACLQKTFNPDVIQALLSQGADPLGAIHENSNYYDDHLYGEVICELSMQDGRNLPEITKLFLDAGMDIEKPIIPYDNINSLNPLWDLAFCANENGIRTLKLLLDAGISKESALTFFDHLTIDTASVYDGDLTYPACLNDFIWGLKMLMLVASHKDWVENDDYLQFWIGYQYNQYDIKKFQNWDAFDYVIDYSKAQGFWEEQQNTYAPVPRHSIVKIYEKATKQLVWSFVYGSKASPTI